MRYSVRPISDRTWLGSHGKEASRFSAKWSDTLRLLGYEIDVLDGSNVALEIDIRDADLKLNGELRANASPSGPAVVVAFETPKHGQLIYQCDHLYTQYYSQGPDWQHNVRAIAKHLESQRAQDRWGVAGVAGGIYGGFKAIGSSAKAMPAAAARMSTAQAVEEIRKYAPAGATQEEAYRFARKYTHPDLNGGSHDAAYRVDEAAQVLGLA